MDPGLSVDFSEGFVSNAQNTECFTVVYGGHSTYNDLLNVLQIVFQGHRPLLDSVSGQEYGNLCVFLY